MRLLETRGASWFVGVALLAGIGASTAEAIYLDEDRDIALRARIYSQASIRLEDSDLDTIPDTQAGQLVQHRNFYNPELDAKLAKHFKWMKGVGLGWLQPDDFSFRIAAWGFYDGIYDYGSSQFGDRLEQVNNNYPRSAGSNAFFIKGQDFSCPKGFDEDTSPCVNADGRPFNSLFEVFPGHELQKPRDIFSSRERVNELYLSYSKGPVFLRVGRQAISWGEADTIALLDQNNPFDITSGPPGAFLDLEEARIPLWTIRASYNLFENLGPFASGSLEAYWVPGWIDTNTGIIPLLTASPYSPRGKDPQQTINDLVEMQIGGVANHQFVLLDSQPDKTLANSRYGFRFQTVIARDHTFSAWFYTHFPSQPAARSLGSVRITPQTPGDKRFLFVTETVHKLTSVYGVADSFFLEPLDSIIRAEVEFFENEPGFIPTQNLGAGPGKESAGLSVLFHKGSVPVQDMLRWELGVDRFFFVRALNPANAFLLSAAVVGHYNLDETDQKDFYAVGQRRPGKLGDSTDDFVDLKPVEAFLNVHLENQWRHGKIFLGFTGIAHSRATFALLPEVRYRFSDSLLFSAKLAWIGGNFNGIGQFKDRDQLSLRATYQLN